MEPAETFTEALARRVLLCDGAMGTLAQATGVRADGPGVELCVVAPELVDALHRRYLAAGADVLQTHTFGASRLRLARDGLAGRVRELNLAGTRLATAVRDGAGRPVWVAGSVSPGSTMRRSGPAAEVAAAVREQVEALAEGGVDLILLETFSRADEMVAAIAAVREVTDLPVVAQSTFVDDDGTPLTEAGESPGDVLTRMADVGIAAVGTNCTLGPQGLLTVLRRMRGLTDLPLTAQPNAGLPHVVAERSVRFAADAEHFARYVTRYVAAGARLVGGCCGTTPEHTAAAAAAIAASATAVEEADLPPAPIVVERPHGSSAVRERVGTAPGRGGVDRWLWARRGQRGFLVAAEIGGRGSPADHLERARAAAGEGARMLWVSRARVRRSSTSAGVAVHLHENVDVDTALTVTSWDTSAMALQADLLGLHALGVRTVVCETGNPPVHADQSVRDGTWEVDTLGLLRLASGLNHGVDGDGQLLGEATAFRLGARFTPGADDLDREARRALAKVESGAEFLITRPIYELDRLRAIVDALGGRVPVLASIGPLVGFAQAEHVRHEMPDVVVPDEVLDRMRHAGEGPAAARTGLEIAEELVRAAVDLVDGVMVRWSGPAVEGVDPGTAVARLATAARSGARGLRR